MRNLLLDFFDIWFAHDVFSQLQEVDKEEHPEQKRLTLQADLISIIEGRSNKSRHGMYHNAEQFEAAINFIHDTCSEYLCNQANISLLLADGEDGLRERLHRSRSRVFVDGVGENTLNSKRLDIIPTFSENTVHNHGFNEIERQLRRISLEVMHKAPTIHADKPTEAPMIYFSDRFRAAEEIWRIWDYYYSYEAIPKGSRQLYHIAPGIAELPEIVTANHNEKVHCGNLNCLENLSLFDRSHPICPGCTKPIWNRCGNVNCTANNVHELILKQAKPCKDGKLDIPLNCPSCNQMMSNYWWRCQRHLDKLVPIDKVTCPMCQAEYQKGEITDPNIMNRRADANHFSCPGCETIGYPERNFQIPFEFRPYYCFGVNGKQTLKFESLLKKYRVHDKYRFLDPTQCPNHKRLHHWIPICPNKTHWHHPEAYLFFNKESEQWSCTEHTQESFFTCFHCDYPILVDGAETKKCPRCLTKLSHCYFCSDQNRRFYPIDESDEHCAGCKNTMALSKLPYETRHFKSIKQPAYCPDYLGCKAGKHPWITATDYDLKHCHVCPDKPLALLPYDYLNECVTECPFCRLILSPLPQGFGFEEIDFKDLESYLELFLKTITSKDTEKWAQASCYTCGRPPIEWIYQMWKAELLSKDFPLTKDDSSGQNYTIITGMPIALQRRVKC